MLSDNNIYIGSWKNLTIKVLYFPAFPHNRRINTDDVVIKVQTRIKIGGTRFARGIKVANTGCC